MQLARVIGEVVATIEGREPDGDEAARAAAARRVGRAGRADARRARFGRRRRRRERLLRPRPRSRVSVLSRRAADRRRHRRDRGLLAHRTDGQVTVSPMQIARVVGTVVSTQKNRKLEGAKLLLVQPLIDSTTSRAAWRSRDRLGRRGRRREGAGRDRRQGRRRRARQEGRGGRRRDHRDHRRGRRCRRDRGLNRQCARWYERGDCARWCVQAVARHLQDSGGRAVSGPLTFAAHVSHVRYVLPESDGPCLIEPTVQCNHCGYCQSHGH